MGFNVELVAVRGITPNDVYTRLQLEATAHTESEPESPVVAASLASGWLILYFNDRTPPPEGELASLSIDADVCSSISARWFRSVPRSAGNAAIRCGVFRMTANEGRAILSSLVRCPLVSSLLPIDCDSFRTQATMWTTFSMYRLKCLLTSPDLPMMVTRAGTRSTHL